MGEGGTCKLLQRKILTFVIFWKNCVNFWRQNGNFVQKIACGAVFNVGISSFYLHKRNSNRVAVPTFDVQHTVQFKANTKREENKHKNIKRKKVNFNDLMPIAWCWFASEGKQQHQKYCRTVQFWALSLPEQHEKNTVVRYSGENDSSWKNSHDQQVSCFACMFWRSADLVCTFYTAFLEGRRRSANVNIN